MTTLITAAKETIEMSDDSYLSDAVNALTIQKGIVFLTF